jgi:hypothetical protein
MPKSRELKPHYSGTQSKRFWNLVNSVEEDAAWAACYQLGCILQEVEIRVLKIINSRKSSQAGKCKNH